MIKKRLALLFVFSVVLIIVLLLNNLGVFNITEKTITGSGVTGVVVGESCTSEGDCSAGVEFCLNNACARTCAYYTNEVNCSADPLSIANYSNDYFILPYSNYTSLPSGGFCGTGIILEYNSSNMTVTSCDCLWNGSVCGDSPTLQFVESQGGCAINWTAYNTTCTSNEESTIYYIDENNCGVTTGRPSNKTGYCDYNGNGLIGDDDDAIFTGYDVEFEIAGNAFNFSKSYSGIKKIELIENNSVIVEFNWNFNNAFNFKAIELKRQTTSASLGSILINGLDVNKTVYMDRIAGASKVCIKDEEVDSVSDITSNCGDTDEYPLNCPGSGGGYTCSIVNNTFKIAGLMHSAVIEYEGGNASTTCTNNWNCTGWGDCVVGSQIRICIDLNKCNLTSGKPAESQTCSDGCSSSWSCTEWGKCEDSKQIRVCVDLNDCAVETNSQEEERECESKTINWPLILGILGVLILLGVLVAIILYFLNKQEEDVESGGSYGSEGSLPPSQPPIVPGSVQAPRPFISRPRIQQTPQTQPRPTMIRPMPRNSVPAKSAPMNSMPKKPITIPKVTPPPK